MMATMAPTFRYPDKPRPGDAVAMLSPSAGLPARFPLPYELGLSRLRDGFGLRPVEYPTTRAAQASPAEWAADIHAAFADPDIKAVIASIGGEDELKVLAHLDPDLLGASPKPFFGYSDNTNLHLFLWNLGLRTGMYMRPDNRYEGAVLFLETSEEMPPASYVHRVLMCMGERRLLLRFAAVAWGRPKRGQDGRAGRARAMARRQGGVRWRRA
jgi:muramoyltetrapeptide carboxypeptidase LdcA involved in peptidoglycan recycling